MLVGVLEQRFRMRAKALQRLAEYARVLDAVDAVAQAYRSTRRPTGGLAAMADRFLESVRDEAVPRARECVEALGRSFVRAVAEEPSMMPANASDEVAHLARQRHAWQVDEARALGPLWVKCGRPLCPSHFEPAKRGDRGRVCSPVNGTVPSEPRRTKPYPYLAPNPGPGGPKRLSSLHVPEETPTMRSPVAAVPVQHRAPPVIVHERPYPPAGRMSCRAAERTIPSAACSLGDEGEAALSLDGPVFEETAPPIAPDWEDSGTGREDSRTAPDRNMRGSDVEAQWALEEGHAFDAARPSGPTWEPRTAEPPPPSGASPEQEDDGAAGGCPTSRNARALEASQENALLVIDLDGPRVVYRGHEIPIRPPHHLQPQPLYALAVLASRPGEVLTMAELAQGMVELGSRPRGRIGSDAADIRYRILRPFRETLAGRVKPGEIERIVETVRGTGVRLALAPESVVVRFGSAG